MIANLLSSLVLASCPLIASDPSEAQWIAADRLHVGNGEVVEDALVQIEDGRIASITRGKPPEGAIYIAEAHLTPGLIDAYSFMGVGEPEQSRESTPSHSVLAAADLDSPAFGYAAQQGVTTALLTPDSLNVIGGLAAAVKTHGGQPANLFAKGGAAAKVLKPDVALKITIGNDPASRNNAPRFGPPRDLFSRRPTTRMGTIWVIRREFYRAREYAKNLRRGQSERDPDLEVLVAVLEGRLPMRVQARRSHDVQTALRLQQEFQIPKVLIEEGTEAHKVADMLAQSGTPVVTGPAYDSVQRAVVLGSTMEALRLAADPPPVCCEHLAHSHEALGDYAMPRDGYEKPEIEGFGLDLMLLTLPEGATAASVNFRWQEGQQASPATAALLHSAGVPIAIGAGEAHDSSAVNESSVIHQARNAHRYGLPAEEAIALVTSQAARLSGVADRVGTVEAGKDADLVLWSGDPLDTASRPLLVMIDGRIVQDDRPGSAQ